MTEPTEPAAPRVAPLAPRDWPPAMRDALAVLRPEDSQHAPPPTEGRPKALNLLGTFAHHPALTKAYNTFNGHLLYNTTLNPRQRELLVLRVAAVRGAEYEWRQHVVLAGDAGLTGDEIRHVAEGADAAGWAPFEAALLRAVDELIAGATVTDATWAALAEELDEQQLLDVVFTVGAYDVVAMMMRSFAVPLDADLADITPLPPTPS